MKLYNSNTKLLILSGIFCYIVLLSFAPLLHDHIHIHDHDACNGHENDACHENEDEHEHENEHSEQSHTEESCAACVFLNTHIQIGIQSNVIKSPTFYRETLPLSEEFIWTFSPTASIQSRAPPVFSNSI